MLGEREITSLPAHRVVAAGIGYVPQTRTSSRR
jgi:ABC-type branched-subunit amino acid transport system ATPase component